jgi:hypothetical protein
MHYTQHTCNSAMPQPIRVMPSTKEGLAKSTLIIANGGRAASLRQRRLLTAAAL